MSSEHVSTERESPGPSYMAVPMLVRYGENKEIYVNPNAGFASVMEHIRQSLLSIGITSEDHIELCDEEGHLLNQDDYPSMMFITNFVSSDAEVPTFVPAKVSRDSQNKVLKADLLLKNPEQSVPGMYGKIKKHYHLPVFPDGRPKKKVEVVSTASTREGTPLPASRESSISAVRMKKRQQLSRPESRISQISQSSSKVKAKL